MIMRQTTDMQTCVRKHHDTTCVHAELKRNRPCSIPNIHAALH